MYVRRFRAISVVVLARSCLASMLDYIVMQVRKTNREKAMIANACSIGQNRNWPSWVDKNCLSDFLYSNMDFSKQLLEEK